MTATQNETWPLLVGGKRLLTGETIAVTSPWSGEKVATVAVGGPTEAQQAVDAAASAMTEGLPAATRARILDRAADAIHDRAEEIGRLMALEIGKPVTAAATEIARCEETLRFSAVAARTLAGRVVPMDAHPAGVGHVGFTLRVPVGVVGAITPFNFPLNLAAHKIGPAVAAGCASVLKPAQKAPLTSLMLAETLHGAGLPPEWLSVVVGPAEEIVGVLLDDERVTMLTFTGSSEVGWELRRRAPRKRVSLELGNSTPLIVCADADLEAAAAAAAATGFTFAGQSCISVQRVLVERSVHDEFAELLVRRARETSFGDPLEPETVVGPVIEADARERVADWIDQAVRAGAQRLVGGTDPRGHIAPTVLADVPREAAAYAREIFGPVLCLIACASLDEALDLANETEYGLQAGIYTKDIDSALTAAYRLEFGGVTINESPSFRVEQMPYGGVKASGNTREGPAQTVLEMTEERMVVIGTGAL